MKGAGDLFARSRKMVARMMEPNRRCAARSRRAIVVLYEIADADVSRRPAPIACFDRFGFKWGYAL
jgi:hypothetical protein